MCEQQALYIKHQGRSWCVWTDGCFGLKAIPEDEQEFNEKDMESLSKYLKEEGFFADFFKSEDDADEMGF